MAGRTHRSIVATKFGDRPLIDVPPISFPQHASYQPRYKNPGNQMGNLADDLNLPPNSYQTVMPMFPQQNYSQPSYGYRPGNPHNPYGNVIQNSNVIPYQNTSQPYHSSGGAHCPQPYQNGGHPTSGAQNGGIEDASGEIHHFYGPHGERISGPIANMNFGFPNSTTNYHKNFKIKGKLKRGQMTSIEVVESNISYRDLPDVVIRDLKRLYGHMEKADVTIMAENGEYHIYATPKDNGAPLAQPGYMYDRGGRHGIFTADSYTKKYRTDDVHNKYDPNAKSYPVHPRSFSVASEGRRPRDYQVAEDPRLPVPKPVRRDF